MFNSVNTCWTLVAAFLVYFMQAGFALCEAGFTRAKNTGNILMKNMMDFCIGTPCYWLIGFGIMFGGTGVLPHGGGHDRARRYAALNQRLLPSEPSPPNYPEFADLFYAYRVLDSSRFVGESSYLVWLRSNQASFISEHDCVAKLASVGCIGYLVSFRRSDNNSATMVAIKVSTMCPRNVSSVCTDNGSMLA